MSLDIVTQVQLLNNASVPSEDRRIIFNQVQAWQGSLNSWQVCGQFLSQAKMNDDPSILLFFLNTLETYCASLVRFESIPLEGRNFIRQALLSLLGQEAMPTMIRKKSSAILIMMGKREFSSSWPTFCDFVLSSPHQELLLSMCETLQDNTRMSFTKFKSDELRVFANQVCGPRLVQRLFSFLDSNNNTVVLSATYSLLEWVPLEHIPLEFVHKLLVLPRNNATVLRILSNLLDRNYVLGQLDLVRMLGFFALELLQPQQQTVTGEFTEATLSFLYSLTKRHFTKLEQLQPAFPMQSYLELMFAFTLRLTNIDHFYSVLEIWELFVVFCQEFELNREMPSPLAGPVIGPLLVRFLNLFLYSNASSPAFLDGLATSHTLQGDKQQSLDSDETAGDDDEEEEDDEESDLTLVIHRILQLIQRTSFLPYSSAAGLSLLLQSCFQTLQQQLASLSDTSTSISFAQEHDLCVCLQSVSRCSNLFVLDPFASLKEVQLLCEWTERLVNLPFPTLMMRPQALTSLQSFLPWAKRLQYVDFPNRCATLALQTLSSTSFHSNQKEKRAGLQLLYMISPTSGWINQVGSLHAFSRPLSLKLGQRLYMLFTLATVLDYEEVFVRAVREDVHVVCNPQSSLDQFDRALSFLQASVEATVHKPETLYKQHLFQLVANPVLASCLQRLDSPASLRFLSCCFQNLRRQLGDVSCMEIIQRVLTVLHSNHAWSVQQTVLELLLSVVEEPTNAFDNLLPSLVQYISQPGKNVDWEEPVSKIELKLMMQHWKWCKENVPSLDLVLSALVLKLDLNSPPDLVRFICKQLDEISDKHGLFRWTHFQSQVAPQYCANLLRLLASREREMIADELVQGLFVLFKADPSFFVHTLWVAMKQGRFPDEFRLNAQNLDQGIFEETILGFCAQA